VRGLDLEAIAFKVAFDEGLSLAEVDRAEFMYRCFLQANLNNPTMRLAPTREIDLFWHHHILDTHKYMLDCQSLFGRYLHHFPYSGLRGTVDKLEQSQRCEVSLRIYNDIATSERKQHECDSRFVLREDDGNVQASTQA
jgi:hypothetical protein